MVHIWEPRYRDKSLLIDIKKLDRGEDNIVKVVKGYYEGQYLLKSETVERLITDGAVEHRNYKGGEVDLLVVPLEEVLDRKEEDNDEWEGITTLLK